jgi:hypothetical protein
MSAQSSTGGVSATPQTSSKKGSQRDRHEPGQDVDRGPGLFFAGLLAFVAQVLVLCYMALSGF